MSHGCHWQGLLEKKTQLHLGAVLLVTRLIEWMHYPVPKETHIACQSAPILFLHCRGVLIGAAAPWLWMIQGKRSKGFLLRGPRALLISAESFGGEQAFSKHKQRTWWMRCQQRASARSIWPSPINLRFYDGEQWPCPASSQQVWNSGVQNVFMNWGCELFSGMGILYNKYNKDKLNLY